MNALGGTMKSLWTLTLVIALSQGENWSAHSATLEQEVSFTRPVLVVCLRAACSWLSLDSIIIIFFTPRL